MKVTTSGWIAAGLPLLFVALTASAEDNAIYIQCPTTTSLHPSGGPEIKCIHLAAGDGMVTMADDMEDPYLGGYGKKQYIFSFSNVPLPGEPADPMSPADCTIPANQADPALCAPTDPAIYAGWVMDYGLLSANAPAPTISVDEDDEVYLHVTNVGMALRPDLSDPHTVHWHGFPNASAVFDGVPDSSISINMGATLPYFYQPVDAGTYMYHCHVEATEHMQMGMLGNLYVRPRQNKLPDMTMLGTHMHSNPDAGPGDDPLVGDKYAYNDGDGSTYYDMEVPIQIGSFDPDFHDASYLVQPLPFRSMKDRYFLLNGRGYPDTNDTGVLQTTNDLGRTEDSQPVSASIEADVGDIILLRISNLNVTLFNTLGTNGLPMKVIALDARLLRDDDGNDMYYMTNSITLGGGQSADVLIDTSPLTSGDTFFLYSKNLDRLANDHENFGGAMTEIHIN
jgi:FtsP/CotA-like multicopper oxidase with cupredoxin domain